MLKTGAPTLFRSLSNLTLLSLLILLVGCVTPPAPYEEYSLARTAINAAQEADASRFASGLWYKAEENYRNGQKAYREAEFAKAKKFFEVSIQYSERAENATRLKKFKSGDGFP